MLTDTSARFGHFREVLLAMEGRADANGLAAEIVLLRAIRSRSDRILQNAGSDHLLTMAVFRNRFLLPGAGIALETTKGDEDALRLIKLTGSVQFGDANAPPSRDGGRTPRRSPRFEPPGKGGLYSQVGARHYAPTLVHRGPTGKTPWGPTVIPPSTNFQQAAGRNTRPGSRQQHFGAAAGSAATPHQLREGQNQHDAEQAAKLSRPNAPQGRHVCFDCRLAGRPCHHPYKACAWTMFAIVNGWGTPSESVPGTSFRNKGMSSGVGGGRFGPTRAAGSRVLCSLVGVP